MYHYCCVVHQELVEKAGILHRDISINNIMLYDAEHPNGAPSTILRQNSNVLVAEAVANFCPPPVKDLLETMPRCQAFRKGLLIDLDYACFLNLTEADVCIAGAELDLSDAQHHLADASPLAIAEAQVKITAARDKLACALAAGNDTAEHDARPKKISPGHRTVR